MKAKNKRNLELDYKIHREASQGAAAMAGIPWCYIESRRHDFVGKHPVKQLTKGKRRKP